MEMQKIINVLREFLDEPWREERVRAYHIYDILWDTDGEEVDLPEEVTVSDDELGIEDQGEDWDIDNAISDWLSNEYGWTTISYSYRKI